MPSQGFTICNATTETALLIADEDFEGGNGSFDEWTNGYVDTSLINTTFTTFLGRYASNGETGTMPFRFYDVPSDTDRLVLRFDLYEFDSWDGPRMGGGVDNFRLDVTSGRSVDSFSFVLSTSDQEEGELEGVSDSGLITWSRTRGENAQQAFLGFDDQIHTVTVDIPSAFIGNADQIRVEFVFDTDSGVLDEAGGLDNVRLEACFDQ